MTISSPTFDTRAADVILRTSIEQGSHQFKDFRVHKATLSIASATFRDMFSSPQPSQPAARDNSLPIIQVTESPETFETFLQLMYPLKTPAINSLQLVDDLFRLADKYVANGVHAKLRRVLARSSSFLKDDPIWFYTIACRAGLDAEARLAIPHTFNIDPVRGIPLARLQMMTAEEYNRLLVAHAARRSLLLSAVNGTAGPPYPGKCSCGVGLYTRLRKDISLAIWREPFLDRQKLESCTPDSESKCGRGSSCRVSDRAISKYFTSILREVEKLE